MIKRGLDPIWSNVIVVKSFFRIGSCICGSAALFSLMILGNDEETLRFMLYLSVLLLIFLLIKFAHGIWNFPRLEQLFDLTINAVTIPVFFATIKVGATTIVFFLFVGMSLLSKMCLYILESYPVPERVRVHTGGFTFKIFASAVFLLGCSVLFGLLQYEQIPAAFGGGHPQAVEIMINDETVSSGFKDMGFEVTPFLKARLIYENQQEYIVDVGGQIFRLSRNAVAGLRVLPVENAHWLLE